MTSNPYESPQTESKTTRQKFPWRLVFWAILICFLIYIAHVLDSQLFTLARPKSMRETLQP